MFNVYHLTKCFVHYKTKSKTKIFNSNLSHIFINNHSNFDKYFSKGNVNYEYCIFLSLITIYYFNHLSAKLNIFQLYDNIC